MVTWRHLGIPHKKPPMLLGGRGRGHLLQSSHMEATTRAGAAGAKNLGLRRFQRFQQTGMAVKL